MSYLILPSNLHGTADKVRSFFYEDYGLRNIRVEEAIDDDVNWRPTVSGDTSDHHLICVEVTDGGYTSALDNAIVQLMTKGLPVRLFIAFPSDKSVDSDKVLATFRTASDKGIGIVEVRTSGRCNVRQNAIKLSLAAVRRIDRPSIARKYRQAFVDAESTFLNGDPAKGCSRVYDELEALSRKLGVKAANLGWWNPGTLNVDTGPWSRVLTGMIGGFTTNIADVRGRCPTFELSLLNGISGVTGHRNDSGHKPRSRRALMTRDAQLRTRFEHATDLFVALQKATGRLRL